MEKTMNAWPQRYKRTRSDRQERKISRRTSVHGKKEGQRITRTRRQKTYQKKILIGQVPEREGPNNQSHEKRCITKLEHQN